MPDPNKIEGGRWDRLLRSVFNLKGAGSTSARIAEDISPTFNFPYRTEHEYLVGDRILWGRCQSVGTAGLRARVLLTNNSQNKEIITDFFSLSVTTGAFPYIGASSAPQPFVAAVPIFPRDGRWGPLETDIGLGTSQLQEAPVAVAPLPVIMTLPVSVGVVSFHSVNVVLQPGDHIFIADVLVNHTFTVTWFWREHTMEPSEIA